MLSPSVPSAESAGGSCYLLVFVFGVVHSHGISKVCLLISSPGSDVKAQCNISVCSSAAALLIQCYKQLAAHLDRVRDAWVRKPFVHLNLLCRQSTAVNLLQPHSHVSLLHLSENNREQTQTKISNLVICTEQILSHINNLMNCRFSRDHDHRRIQSLWIIRGEKWKKNSRRISPEVNELRMIHI